MARLKTASGGRPGGVAVHIYPSPITAESRIMRATDVVASMDLFDEVIIVGTSIRERPDEERLDERRRIIRVPRPYDPPQGLWQRVVNTHRWGGAVWRRLAGEPITCINARHLAVLPVAVRLKQRHHAVLIYDPHELETETTESRGIRRLVSKATERRLIRHADAVICVGQGIADWYRRTYGLERVFVFRNIPHSSLQPAPTAPGRRLLRERCGIPDEVFLFIYQGNMAPHRRVEQYLRVFAGLPADRHLVLMGFGPLAPLAEAAARRHGNIHVLPAVPSREVLQYTQGADVGLCGVEDICLNHTLCLPNKFFEYLFAGVPVLSPPFPEMAQVIERTNCGWLVERDSDEGYADAIMGIDRAALAAAGPGVRAAAQSLSFEDEAEALRGAYAALWPAEDGHPRVAPAPARA